MMQLHTLHVLTLQQSFRRKQNDCLLLNKKINHLWNILSNLTSQSLYLAHRDLFRPGEFKKRMKCINTFMNDLQSLQPITIRTVRFVKHHLGLYIMEQRLLFLLKTYGSLYLSDLVGQLWVKPTPFTESILKFNDKIIPIRCEITEQTPARGRSRIRTRTRTRPHSRSQSHTRSSKSSEEDELEVKDEEKDVTREDPRVPSISLSPLHPHNVSLYSKLNGIRMVIKLKGKTINISAIAKDDPLKQIRRQDEGILEMKDCVKQILVSQEKVDSIWDPLIDIISLRDWIVESTQTLYKTIKDLYMKQVRFRCLDIPSLTREYNLIPPSHKFRMLQLLCLNKAPITEIISKGGLPSGIVDWDVDIPEEFIQLHLRSKSELDGSTSGSKENEETEDERDVPYLTRIDKMHASKRIKKKAVDMFASVARGSGDNHKAKQYLDGLLNIPFGKYKEEKILNQMTAIREKLLALVYSEESLHDFRYLENASESRMRAGIKQIRALNPGVYAELNDVEEQLVALKEKKIDYIHDVNETLCNAVHGHDDAKRQIKRLIAQWMQGKNEGMVLGLQGPPGNGKTTLIKKGLSKCLVDEHGKARPVGFISLGGASRGSALEGHGYTYQGAKWGRIVDVLMTADCLNPILLFDELDKVSHTEHGQEIIGILTHLTDSTQNSEFNDRYFDGIPIDLSKALVVFTFNDMSRIDPILLDRITVIETKALTMTDKMVVSYKHLLPEIMDGVGFSDEEVPWTDEIITYIIDTYTREAGARKLKEILKVIVREMNLQYVEEGVIPELNIAFVDETLRTYHKITSCVVPEAPLVGQINGLYANVLGIGGILPIQVNLIHSTSALSLKLTGMQGDVMKESMDCALTMAMQLLGDDKYKELKEEWDTCMGLHVHCPSAATPKDGPSAGIAITMAMLSRLRDQPINPLVAITGEIDIQGNACPIGGLRAKLDGAKKAGAKIILIPKKENWTQYEKLIENNELDVGRMEIIPIEHVRDALNYVFKE